MTPIEDEDPVDMDDTTSGVYFDKSGDPISLRRWAELTEDREYRRVARTEIRDEADPEYLAFISTIWTGVDVSVRGVDDAPVLFQTLVFNPKDENNETSMMLTHSTLEWAVHGHGMTVRHISRRLTRPVVTDIKPDETTH